MSEIITTYLLDDLDQPVPMDRDEFYASQIQLFKEGKKPNRAVAIVDVLLFDTDKQVILQERSRNKKHNPGMIDKTMGGHQVFGDSVTYTVMIETLQELNVPAFVLDNNEDFVKTLQLIEKFTQNTCVVEFIESRTTNLKNVFREEGVMVPIAKKYYFYLGVYNGSLKPTDKEAAAIRFIGYPDLLQEIKEDPSRFTDDLQFFVQKYNKEITDFLSKTG